MNQIEAQTISPPFSLPVRVYYEDTDAGGVIYYANYLRFFERCRAEWLRQTGFDQGTLLREYGVAFVVRAVGIEYLAPGRLDDLLDIGLEVEKIGRAQIVFRHRVWRREENGETSSEKNGGTRELVSATVQVVCVALEAMKSTALPAALRSKLEALQMAGTGEDVGDGNGKK